MIIIRTLLAVVVLFIVTKILGKRQVSQLSLFEYITGITIGSLAAYISLELDDKWYLGLLSLFVWVMFSLGIEFLQLKSKKARDFIDGKATVLIRDGKILEDNLKKERLTSDELMEQLRKRRAFRIADVEFAIMEPSGDINILLKRDNLPLTPKHLGIQVAPEKESQAVIMDGQIMDNPLVEMKLTREWLYTELEKLGVPLENVFFGQVDSYGQLFVDLYNDQLDVPAAKPRELLFATLKKCEADIMLFGLSTESPQAKAMYERCATDLGQVVQSLTPVLHR